MVLAGYMFQRKIDKLFEGLPNMLGIVDDILIAGIEGSMPWAETTMLHSTRS